jgi:hypothetical protein
MNYVDYLPDNAHIIDLSGLGLTELPDMTRFYCVEKLYCDDNLITYIPYIPTLEVLSCENNQISFIPSMPRLRVLFCDDNDIEYLPYLPNIHYITMTYNPCKYDYKGYNKLCQVIYLVYCLKFKKKFVAWLWSVRRQKIEEKYHPDNLMKLINSSENWEEALNEW